MAVDTRRTWVKQRHQPGGSDQGVLKMGRGGLAELF